MYARSYFTKKTSRDKASSSLVQENISLSDRRFISFIFRLQNTHKQTNDCD